MTEKFKRKQEREKACVLDELVRASVGCEDFEDLRDDLDQALSKIPQSDYQQTKKACFA